MAPRIAGGLDCESAFRFAVQVWWAWIAMAAGLAPGAGVMDCVGARGSMPIAQPDQMAGILG
jgi:hypothetical protein